MHAYGVVKATSSTRNHALITMHSLLKSSQVFHCQFIHLLKWQYICLCLCSEAYRLYRIIVYCDSKCVYETMCWQLDYGI